MKVSIQTTHKPHEYRYFVEHEGREVEVTKSEHKHLYTTLDRREQYQRARLLWESKQ